MSISNQLWPHTSGQVWVRQPVPREGMRTTYAVPLVSSWGKKKKKKKQIGVLKGTRFSYLGRKVGGFGTITIVLVRLRRPVRVHRSQVVHNENSFPSGER